MPVDANELRVVQEAIRKYADQSSFGHMVTDARILEVATVIMQALEDYHSGTVI